MKKLIPFFFLFGICFAEFQNLTVEWDQFKTLHDKRYATQEEEAKRLMIYLDTKNFIEQHNEKYLRGEVSFYCGMNQFGDMTLEEFSDTITGFIESETMHEVIQDDEIAPEDDMDLPNRVNWVTKGAVTGVKNQRHCASSWSFAATGALEGHHFIHNGELISLSEQNLIDCDRHEHGCRGGNVDDTFTFIEQEGGIDSEEAYPYTARKGRCRYNNHDKVATDQGSRRIRGERSMKRVVAKKGPVAAGMNARTSTFKHYRGGLYDPSYCSTSLSRNHAVTIVGYGVDRRTRKPYWLVKNSWGTDWGDNGYVKIRRDKNICGIGQKASYPIV